MIIVIKNNNFQNNSMENTKQKSKIKKVFTKLILVILVIALGWLVSDYIKTKQDLANASLGTVDQQAEIDQILSKVSELIILPEGIPNIAIIEDIDTLVIDQPFFEGAENGDRILIYEEKAIIYSPSRDILVNVGPVYAEEDADTQYQNVPVDNTPAANVPVEIVDTNEDLQ